MKRRRRIFNRQAMNVLVAVLAGLLLGAGIAGFPDSEALNPVTGRPPLTVKPGALMDLSEFSVPPAITIAPPTTVAPGSTTSTSTSSTTSTTVTDGLLGRPDLSVMVANANRTPGSASQWAAELVRLGYAEPAVSNAGERTEWTIYFAEGLQGEAERLAQDLAAELLTITIPTAPLGRAPKTNPVFEGQILLVVGLQELQKSSPVTTVPG